MSIKIESLHREDYHECIDFINMVFSMSSGPTNFPKLLPTYYQETEEHMQCHRVLRENGRIKALVGIYPGHVQVGNTELSLARIGAVSTHPASQGKGYMRQLMTACMEEVRGSYDISHLGGLRLRYLYFGYDRCGFVPTFTLNENTIKHAQIDGSVQLRSITKEDHDLLEQMRQLHDTQTIHGIRSKERFPSTLYNWSHRPTAAMVNDQLVGYAVTDENGSYIAELVAQDEKMALLTAQAILKANKQEEVKVVLSPAQPKLIQFFDQYCDDVEVHPNGNWQIIQWQKTLDALFRVQHQIITGNGGSLLPGSAVVEIEGHERLLIHVTDKDVTVSSTDRTPDLSGSAHDMMRLFFGPLRPGMTIASIPKMPHFHSWLPLPLYLPQQDHA